MSSSSSIAPFVSLETTAMPLRRSHVDTDQVIPARFLKGTSKDGLGQVVFHDLRYLDQEGTQLNPESSLNHAQYQGAGILVALENFGCGSSREHAPWALKDYGIHAIIAPSFADIFKNNALKNRVLPIVLPETEVLQLLDWIEAEPTLIVKVNVESATLEVPSKEYHASFPINPFWQACLVQGVDEIGYTLTHLEAIERFEQTHRLYPIEV
ncbi:MAG: 3-isopropylmalate dehydratase small subunit [Vampirovibrionales bacterium]